MVYDEGKNVLDWGHARAIDWVQERGDCLKTIILVKIMKTEHQDHN